MSFFEIVVNGLVIDVAMEIDILGFKLINWSDEVSKHKFQLFF